MAILGLKFFVMRWVLDVRWTLKLDGRCFNGAVVVWWAWSPTLSSGATSVSSVQRWTPPSPRFHAECRQLRPVLDAEPWFHQVASRRLVTFLLLALSLVRPIRVILYTGYVTLLMSRLDLWSMCIDTPLFMSCKYCCFIIIRKRQFVL